MVTLTVMTAANRLHPNLHYHLPTSLPRRFSSHPTFFLCYREAYFFFLIFNILAFPVKHYHPTQSLCQPFTQAYKDAEKRMVARRKADLRTRTYRTIILFFFSALATFSSFRLFSVFIPFLFFCLFFLYFLDSTRSLFRYDFSFCRNVFRFRFP